MCSDMAQFINYTISRSLHLKRVDSRETQSEIKLHTGLKIFSLQKSIYTRK